MTTSMQLPPINKKPPWWRRIPALERGLALCIIILCTALAVGIVVIVFNSRSCDASDDAPGMQPPKAEALMWGHLLLKRYKIMKKVVTTAVTRRDGFEPESKQLPTTKPKEVVSKTDATRRGRFEPESKPPPTIKPKEVVSTTAATQRDAFAPEFEPPRTAKPKEVVSTTTAMRLNATGTTPEPSNNIDVCSTAGCKHTEKMILDNMDRTIDSCEDFYGYACGGFLKSTKIPDDRTSVDILTQLGDQLQEQLKNIIDADIVRTDFYHFKHAKILYSSCMDHKSITAAEVENLRSTLKDFGGWPLLEGDSWYDLVDNWQWTMNAINDRGYSGNYLMKFEVDVDKKNSTKHIIYLDEPDLELSHVFLTNDSDELKNAYYSYMEIIAVLLGANKTSANEELKAAVQFEGKLAKISLPVHERFNEAQLYNPMTLNQLRTKYPLVYKYCAILMRDVIDMSPDEVVIVKSDGYVAGLQNLISQSSSKDVANYLMWRVVMESTFNLNDGMRKRSLAYETRLPGRTNYQVRWKECLDLVSDSFPVSLGAMYFKNYSDSQSDQVKNANAIVEDIKKGITDILEKLDWVDEKTRSRALKKATAIHNIIIDPDEFLNVSIFEEFNKNTVPYGIARLYKAREIMRETRAYMYAQLRTPVVKFYWAYKKAISTQVHYSKNDNSIFVPAAILQSPFFGADRPRYMYYGAIGFLIAQQLTHGFDYDGIHYDENGNLVQQMDPTTEERYLQRGQCFDEKYSNYTVKEVDLKLNGRATLSENIADTNGLKAAYAAYNNWISKNGEEQRLPGIDKTPRQLFWISAANVLCSKYRRNALEYKIRTDRRSPAEFRVIGAMSNLAEFAEDFKCSPDSTMNPTKKCSVL